MAATEYFIHPAFVRQRRDDRGPPVQTDLTRDLGMVPLARYIRRELARRRLEERR